MFNIPQLIMLIIVFILLSGVWFSVKIPAMGFAFGAAAIVILGVTLVKYLNHP